MYAILILLEAKKEHLTDFNIHFYSDNKPTVDTLSCRSSRSKQLMIVIRAITLICLQHSIKFSISHIKGKFNVHADKLSHLQLNDFKKVVENVKPLSFWSLEGWAWPLSMNMLTSLLS